MKTWFTYLLGAVVCMLCSPVCWGQTVFGPQQVILPSESLGAISVFLVDLNGDGHTDILSGSEGKIVWYKNKGGGNFIAKQIIGTPDNYSISVFATNIDGDGDLDILSAIPYGLSWYANDELDTFGAQQIIIHTDFGLSSSFPVDLDGDNDIDILASSFYNKKVGWYANDGTGKFGTMNVIASGLFGTSSVSAADFNDDGYNDVVYSFYEGNYPVNSGHYVLVLGINNGNGNFSNVKYITTSTQQPWSNSVYPADLNNDGHTDMMSDDGNDFKIAWYLNDGTGNLYTQQIITTPTNYIRSNSAADLDNDGDLDLVLASWFGSDIYIYTNNGTGIFDTSQVLTNVANDARVYTADLDSDGDVDVLYKFEGKIAWHKNLLINLTNEPQYNFIAPNPTQNAATLTYTAPPAHAATLHLYDLTGRLLLQETLLPTGIGVNEYVLDLLPYPPGLYLVTLNNGTEVVSGKVVRE